MGWEDVLQGSATWGIAVGHTIDVLRSMPEKSVHTCVTSPPYWALRSYSTPPQIWGGSPDCDHEWGDTISGDSKGGSGTPNGRNNRGEAYARGDGSGQFCIRCAAWLGELGKEPDPDLYVAHLILVCNEVWRVLRDDGSFWLNIGDSYFGSGRGPTGHNGIGDQTTRQGFTGHQASGRAASTPRRAKSLALVPERLALALEAAGWYLRSRIAWIKTSGLPESMDDRPTGAWEHIWLLSKKRDYYYDADAVRQPWADERQGSSEARSLPYSNGSERYDTLGGHGRAGLGVPPQVQGANLRNVWQLAAEPVRGAHYATFAPELPERCLLAGTSAHGVCPTCGAPWRRTAPGIESTENVDVILARFAVSERPQQRRAAEIFKQEGLVSAHLEAIRAVGITDGGKSQATSNGAGHNTPAVQMLAEQAKNALGGYYREFCIRPTTTTWQQTCKCPPLPPVPAVVLDPFGGSGTTILAAIRHHRRAIGIELNLEYVQIAEWRIARDRKVMGAIGQRRRARATRDTTPRLTAKERRRAALEPQIEA